MSTSRAFHHGDLKTALARSAAELIERGGIEALSLREVAREAGVSTAAPYRHYPSKEALLAEVARGGFVSLHDELARAGAGLERRPAVLAQCLAYLRFAQRQPALYRLMFGAFPDKPRHVGLVEAGERLFTLLEGQFPRGEESMPIRAVGCWAFVHGLAMLAMDDQLRLHLAGTDDASLRAVLTPMLDVYVAG